MLATRIIPTLLYRGQTLYKGVKFDSWRSVGSAIQAVRVHQARGVDELIMLDIDATKQGRGPDLKMVEKLSSECFMPLTVGGGIRSLDDVHDVLNAGADKVAIRSAIECIPIVADKFGSQAIVAALDYSDGYRANLKMNMDIEMFDFKIDIQIDAVSFSRVLEDIGAGEILLTCVDREGTMEGYDLDMLKKVSQAVNIPVIAHGGCGTYEHMYEAIQAGASAVAAGAMFQFTDQTPRGAAEYLHAKGIEARL